jgi:uncharacterized protein (UPF0335 family)
MATVDGPKQIRYFDPNVPQVPDVEQLRRQVEHLDRLIAEATILRAEVEDQMNTLRRSGDQYKKVEPRPRKRPRRRS